MSRAVLSVTIVGAGRLGTAMARALRRARGVSVAIGSDPDVAGARVVLLAVPDRAIAAVARALARKRPSWRGVVALHAAGMHGVAPLAPLARRGAATGVLHPLAVLGTGRSATLRGASARIEGAPAARKAALSLCRLAGMIPLRAGRIGRPAARARYHAAASLAANDVVALIAAAVALLVRDGVPEREARAALTALAAGAVAQARETGIASALTGPVVRNDVATLEAHFAALDAADPAAAAAHRALSRKLIGLAVAAGRLTRSQARALGRLTV
jgi:predicted short-subunit dehydrogenase-like oxidoreductase (DUF2520 family)